jgi:hypothetical protein
VLEVQMRVLTAWYEAGEAIRARLVQARDDERGEVTSTTVIIVLLVGAALVAGGIIAQKITANAQKTPSP